MAWIALTSEAFADKLFPAEKLALDALKARPGSTADQMLTREIARTVNHVRGYCPAKVDRGPDGTLPDELEDAALAMLRMKYFTSLPDLKKLWSTDRNQEYLQALEVFKLWARGDFRVVAPEAPAPVEEQAAGPAVELLRIDSGGWGEF